MRTGDATVTAVEVETYRVPTDRPEADGTLSWDATVLVLVRARAGDHEGIGWTYAARSAGTVVEETLAGVVTGGDVLAVPAQHRAMVDACRNLGLRGLVSCAISAADVALWDLKARLLDLPLADLWGRARPDAPIYGSGGFTTYDDDTTAEQLRSWLGAGIPRVKIKIAESWGTRPERDLERVRLARRVAGPDAELYVDANGGYTRKQAVRLGPRMVEESGVTWFEEPVSSDDLVGLEAVRSRCDADVAAGEYGYTPDYFTRMIAADAVDCVQADVTRCGGYTGWLAVGALADAGHLQVSGHCAPNLHAHAAVCVPNLRHLEYFHDHVRIEHLLFDGALIPVGGSLVPDSGTPGHGMTLRRVDAEQFRIG